jgi:hypothetical protein
MNSCQRHLVTLQMLEIVRRPDRIDRSRCDRAHIGDRADDVGLHGRVEIESDLAPFGAVKMPMHPLPQRITAADIEHGLPGQQGCVGHWLQSLLPMAGASGRRGELPAR